jgi:transposase
MQFLDNLRQTWQGHEIVLFMDNCSVHHSKKVTAYLKEHKIENIFNIPYCP